MTLRRGENERIIRILGATATEVDHGEAAIELLPLPPELTLISSSSSREKVEHLWVNRTESSLKYTSPHEEQNMRATLISWKTPDATYDRTLYWSTSRGVACRPTHLFIQPIRKDSGKAIWTGEILLSSAIEAIRVTEVTCPDAEVAFTVTSDQLERQKRVKLSIAMKEPLIARFTIAVKTENENGESTDIELPVHLLKVE